MHIYKTYNILKRFVNRVSDSPAYLIFFVTNNCIAKCAHCFYWKEQTEEKKILSIDEIEKIAKTTHSLSFLLLTGGEPYLREDLHEIAYLFYRFTPVRNLATPTNGFLGDKIICYAEKILKKCREAKLTVNVSLDGIGELHDKIRGVPGIFEKAVYTFHGLMSLKKKYKNMQVGIITTISALNQDFIPEIHDFVRNKLNTPIWAPFLVRGSPRDPNIKKVAPDKYLIADKLIQEDIKSGVYKEYTGFIFARFNSAKNVVRRKLIAKILKENKYELPCYAGKINAVLYSDGDIYPCELLNRKIGNIRDYNLDMRNIWMGREAEQVREIIKNLKCFCTHECFLTTNMLYNLKYYPEIAYWWYKYI
ncbi:MAG: radical SAM protein [Candidatus Firestonebacteria bacterium]|nr:radical SAM protein [Candidatus Firestonebacteria bacterium]